MDDLEAERGHPAVWAWVLALVFLAMLLLAAAALLRPGRPADSAVALAAAAGG
jgi:hypothetical protein